MTFKKEHIAYVLIYTLSLVFLLTTQGMFWDDWVIFHVDPKARLELYTMSGRPLFGHFFNLLFFLDHDGFTIFRIVIFLCFLFPIFIVDKLISEISEISSYSRFFLVIFFALFPVNSSRIAITMTQYSFCYFLFFLAFWLTSQYLTSRKIYFRLLALGLFYLSFNMDSLLVFFIIVILYLFYKNTLQEASFKSRFSPKAILKIVVRYLDFFVLPIAYFIIKKLFFTPYGLYSSYNEVTLSKLKNASINFLSNVETAMDPVIKQSARLITQLPVQILLVTAVTYLIISKVTRRGESTHIESFAAKLLFFSFGILLIAFSIFPYFVVNAEPGLYNWSSRHQILMPLGGAFFTFYGSEVLRSSIEALFKKVLKYEFKFSIRSRNCFYSFLISVFMVTILHSHLQYQKDWFKQLSLIENMKNNSVIKEHTSFHFVDNTLELNATARYYNFYEFTGLMKYTFGNETRYGSLSDKFDEAITSAIPYAQYNVSQFVPKPYEFRIEINFGSYELSNINTISLVFYRFYDKSEYHKKIRNIVKLSTTPIS